MPRRNSSTSSSDRAGLRVRGRARKALATVGWTLAFCAAIDVACGLAFRMPAPGTRRPTTLEQYLYYGRSVRGKLERTVGADRRAADPIARAGWLDDLCVPKRPPPPGTLGVAFYGMSFSNEIAGAVAELDPIVRPTRYAGPAAPPNHSYACFLRQRGGRDPNPVQVFCVLASSVRGLLTLTGLTTSFESPTPYTFPRYLPDGNGGLRELTPVIADEDALRHALFRDPAKWRAFVDQLAAHDRFYDATAMGGPTWLDHSTFARFARRSLAQNRVRERGRAIYAPGGFAEDPEVGPVLQAMVRDFAVRCRADGQVPLVVLIQDQGSPDALDKLLRPTLEAAGIPSVNTGDVVASTDPSNFLPDGHFKPAANRRVAERVLARIREIAPR